MEWNGLDLPSSEQEQAVANMLLIFGPINFGEVSNKKKTWSVELVRILHGGRRGEFCYENVLAV